jgi:hypothetical protein
MMQPILLTTYKKVISKEGDKVHDIDSNRL